MLGALVSAGASLIGGLFGRSSAKKKAKAEEKAIREANEAAAAQAAAANERAVQAAAASRARSDSATLAANTGLRAAAQAGEKAIMTASKVPVVTNATTSEYTRGGVDMPAFMAAAERFGFNPLTFLRSGALQYFSTNSSVQHRYDKVTGERAVDAATAAAQLRLSAADAAGSNLLENSKAGDQFLGTGVTATPEPVIARTNVPGVGEIFGNAIQNGANQWLADKSAQENRQFQQQMLNAQLSGSMRHGASTSRGLGNTPQVVTSGGAVTGKGSGSLSPGKPLCIDGIGCLYGNPNTTSAQNISDRTGEAGEWLGGVFVGISDTEYTLRKNAADILNVPQSTVTLPQMIWANEKKDNTPLYKAGSTAYDIMKNPKTYVDTILDWGWNYGSSH